jgi:hypothetical protein
MCGITDYEIDGKIARTLEMKSGNKKKENAAFCNVAPCGFIISRRLYHLTRFLAHIIYSTLKMQTTRSAETPIYNKPTRHHIPESDILHGHRREYLKSYMVRKSQSSVPTSTYQRSLILIAYRHEDLCLEHFRNVGISSVKGIRALNGQGTAVVPETWRMWYHVFPVRSSTVSVSLPGGVRCPDCYMARIYTSLRCIVPL